MSDRTTNYNLEKPLPSEAYEIEVQNGNLDVIDEELKKADNHVKSHEKHITEVERTIWNSKADMAVATTKSNGLMSAADKVKIDGIAVGANNYTHPSYPAKTIGLYKTTVDASGHVSAVAAVAKADITALGIPSQDTVYTHPNDANTRHVTDTEKNTWNGKASAAVVTTTVNGLMIAADKAKLDGIAVGANKTVVANNLTTAVAGSALDALQGRILDGKITEVNNSLGKIITLDGSIDYYVSTTGDNNNSGSKSAPFRTIQKAIDMFPKLLRNTRNNIHISEGIYSENLTITGFKDGYIKLGILGDVVINGGIRVDFCDYIYIEGAYRITINAIDIGISAMKSYFAIFPNTTLIMNVPASVIGIISQGGSSTNILSQTTINGSHVAIQASQGADVYIENIKSVESNHLFYATAAVIRVKTLDNLSTYITKLAKTCGGQILTGAGEDLT